MARANSSFKLPKAVKRMMAATLDPVARRHLKRVMIEAEIARLTQPKREPRERKQPRIDSGPVAE